MKALGHLLHEELGGGSGFGKVLKFLQKLFMRWNHFFWFRDGSYSSVRASVYTNG
jgi:hypothetical protein